MSLVRVRGLSLLLSPPKSGVMGLAEKGMKALHIYIVWGQRTASRRWRQGSDAHLKDCNANRPHSHLLTGDKTINEVKFLSSWIYLPESGEKETLS